MSEKTVFNTILIFYTEKRNPPMDNMTLRIAAGKSHSLLSSLLRPLGGESSLEFEFDWFNQKKEIRPMDKMALRTVAE